MAGGRRRTGTDEWTDGRTDGRATLRVPASKEHCGKAFRRRRAAAGRGRTTTPSLSSFLPPWFARSSAGEGALLLGLMRLVGMQISSLSLSLSLAAYSRTDQQTVKEERRPPELERGSRLGFTGKSGGVLRFLSLSLSSSAIWLILCLCAQSVPRRYRVEWREGSKKKPGQPPLSGDWRQTTPREREREREPEREGSTLELVAVGFGQRKDSISLASSSRPLSACIAISSECRVD